MPPHLKIPTGLEWVSGNARIGEWVLEYLPPTSELGQIASTPAHAVSADAIDALFFRVVPDCASHPIIFDPFIRTIRSWVRVHGDETGRFGLDRVIPANQLECLQEFAKVNGTLPTREEAVLLWKNWPGADEWQQLRPSGVLACLQTERTDPAMAMVLRAAFERISHSPDGPLPQLRELPDASLFITSDTRTSILWNLLDLSIHDEIELLADTSSPQWNEYANGEMEIVAPHDQRSSTWRDLARFFVDAGADPKEFDGLEADYFLMMRYRNWSKRHSIPILVFDLYLRSFYPTIANDTADELTQAFSVFNKKCDPTHSDHYLMEASLLRDIVSYSIGMGMIVRADPPLFCKPKSRGRRRLLQGWFDLLVERVYNDVTPQIVAAAKHGPASLFSVSTAYGEERQAMDRYAVTGVIASALIGGRPITVESVRAALARSRKAPEQRKILKDKWLEIVRPLGLKLL